MTLFMAPTQLTYRATAVVEPIQVMQHHSGSLNMEPGLSNVGMSKHYALLSDGRRGLLQCTEITFRSSRFHCLFRQRHLQTMEHLRLRLGPLLVYSSPCRVILILKVTYLNITRSLITRPQITTWRFAWHR